MLLKEGSVKMLQIGVEKNDSEGVVELQECSQRIRLVPCSSLIHPSLRVFEGIENVMEVNIDAAV